MIARLVPIISISLSSCSALLPNTLSPELEHRSHLTQHAPFSSCPTHYAADSANLIARWGNLSGTYLELGEGLSLDRHFSNTFESGYGETLGPREQFIARFGYSFKIRD